MKRNLDFLLNLALARSSGIQTRVGTLPTGWNWALNGQLTTELPHVYRLALRFCRDSHVAEDLTQETMLKAVQKFESLESPDRLRVWVLRILANTWKDYVRRDTRRQTHNEAAGDVVDRRLKTAEHITTHREELQVALDAMDSLPEKQRAVLHLFAVEGLSLAQIGEVLGMKPSTAKVNLHHARRAMREKLPQLANETITSARPLR